MFSGIPQRTALRDFAALDFMQGFSNKGNWIKMHATLQIFPESIFNTLSHYSLKFQLCAQFC